MENKDKLDSLNDMLNSVNNSSREKMGTQKDFEQAKHHHAKPKKKKMNKAVKVLLIILCVLLSICVALGGTWLILFKIGESQVKPNNDTSVSIKNDSVKTIDYNIVEYNGKKYKFNDKITSILCLGVDKDNLGTVDGVVGTGGQADAVYLIAMDTDTAKLKVICISRDTLCDINIYSKEGEFIGTKNEQLCLSYAYGDGKLTSCENTAKAVSKLFYNIPINTYYAIDKSAVAILNDELGGVNVPIFDENGNDTGKTETVMGSDAYEYVHFRDTKKLESNNLRIQRQLAYLKGFSKKFIEQSKQDLSVPMTFFNISQEYAATNLNASSVTYFATKLLTNGNLKMDFVKVNGEVKRDKDGHAAYHINEDSLTKTVIETYYTEVK